MKTIYPNIWSLLIRFLFLALLLYPFPILLQKLMILFRGYKEGQDAYVFAFTVYVIFIVYILWTLCKILWVKIAADNSTICFHYLYKKIEVSCAEIEKYVDTGIITKRKPINGWLIKLRSGKTLEVSEFNVNTRKPVEDFLKFHKVPRTGVKCSWFPYTRKI